MLRVLGSKRLTFIFGLLGALAVLVYAYYNFIIPAHEQSTQELEASKAAVTQKYADVARLKEEYVLLRSQLKAYKELEVRGFFNDQNRSAAVDNLDKLSKYAGLLKANLKFGPGALIKDSGADLANQVILKSPVSVDIKSIDDVDVYSFIKFVEDKFPGRIDLTSFNLERIEIFDETLLRKIGSGSPTPLVDAKLSFDWLTMAPKTVVAPAEGVKQ